VSIYWFVRCNVIIDMIFNNMFYYFLYNIEVAYCTVVTSSMSTVGLLRRGHITECFTVRLKLSHLSQILIMLVIAVIRRA